MSASVTMSTYLVLACVMAACLPGAPKDRERDATGSMMTSSTMADTLQLTVQFDLGSGELLLKYEVTNRDKRTVYLLNRLWRSVPSISLSPNIVYVDLDPKSLTVLFSKRIPDLPTDRTVTMPFAPYVTPVKAGQTFAEEVRVPVPVREYRQYTSESAKPSARERVYEQAALSLQYYWDVPGTREQVRQIAGASVVMPIVPPGTRIEYGELKSAMTKISVPVIETR